MSETRVKDNLKALNNTFAFAGLGALVLAMSRLGQEGISTVLPFLIFLMLLRIKMWLDDGRYFDETDRTRRGAFLLGILFALATWVIYILTAYSVAESLEAAYVGVLVMIAAATVWVVVAFFQDRSRWKIHLGMFGFNVFYVVGALALWQGWSWGFVTESWLLWMLVVAVTIDALVTGSAWELSG